MERFERSSVMEQTPKAYLTFGAPGHDSEYVFTMHDEEYEKDLPAIAHGMQLALGSDWSVRFRGTRLEIVNKKQAGGRDDALVNTTLQKILGEKYDLEQTT